MNLATKKILACALSLTIGFASAAPLVSNVEAMSRSELAAINVEKSGHFKYWTKDSTAHKVLMDYVKDVTNKKSPNFIPVEDRIAVFDCDGTLTCETAPYYFDAMLSLHRFLDDSSYRPSPKDRATAKEIKSILSKHGKLSGEQKSRLRKEIKHPAFAGMTPEEFSAYLRQYIDTAYEEGLTNLKVGEAFYLPMLEVVSYLKAKNFTVYIVSGCDREMLRVLAGEVTNLPPERIIGTDYNYVAEKHPDAKTDDYNLERNEKILRGSKRIFKDVMTNKVAAIQREIGRKPVLAFGNSDGDYSMFRYTVENNPHKSAAFVLLCDDLQREFGNSDKAAKVKASAEENGWTPVSMRDDFNTIYGDDIKLTASSVTE